MKKDEFLKKLQIGLTGLPKNSIEDKISFYSEMIDDRIEDGLSEEEALEQIGSVNDVISQILSETPITDLVREKLTPKRSLSALEIILLVVGSPLWLTILLVVFILILSVYITILSLLIAVVAVEFALGITAITAIGTTFVYVIQSNFDGAILMLGTGLFCLGSTIIAVLATKTVFKWTFACVKKTTLAFKSLFIKGGKK